MQKIIPNFSGEIITQEDKNYSQFSGTDYAKGTPKIIFRPLTSEDVQLAIEYIRINKLVLSIRSGGHHNAGFSTNKDGAVIDMSAMDKIEVINKEKNIVRIGTGAKWGEVAEYLRKYNLGISSGDTKSVGVGGLTLGGGIGWMVRKYGLAIDNLVGAEIVTANGEVVKMSKDENSELFWAIRGGGGNFGVVTYFEFEAKKVNKVTSGTIIYKYENIDNVLKKWRDYMQTANENLTCFFMLAPGMFGDGKASIMSMFCYIGDKSNAIDAIKDLKKLGEVVHEEISEKDYADVLEEAHPPGGFNITVKNTFAKNFSDEMIDQICNTFEKDGARVMQIRSLTGASQRVGKMDTALAFRDSEIMMFCATFMPLDASEDQVSKAMKVWTDIVKFGNGSYANFISTNTEEDVKSIYPEETYKKLFDIKKKYDPENLFNQNYNIK